MRITLNLLPPPNKAALRMGFVFASMQSMLVIFLIMSTFAAGTLIAVRMLIAGTYQDLAQRNTSSSDEFKEVTAEIREINAYLKRVQAIDARIVPWSSVVHRITELAPAGTRLERIAVSDAGRIVLSGVAATRNDVLLLDQRLKQAGIFTDISSPLSNILQQRNVRFDFEMRYQPPAEAR